MNITHIEIRYQMISNVFLRYIDTRGCLQNGWRPNFLALLMRQNDDHETKKGVDLHKKVQPLLIHPLVPVKPSSCNG